MKLQNLCHLPTMFVLMGFVMTCAAADPARVNARGGQPPGAAGGGGQPPAHDYPTIARVEYVNECVGKHGGKLAALYQCSCAIDRIANALAYDEFVEASTFAKYATLPGEGGGIFRDSDQARKLAKSFRDLESEALRGCGLTN